MQGKDGKFYLRHDYENNYSRNGSVFLTCENSADFSDRYNLLYGHNMLDDSMFGPLLNYAEDPTYIINHPTFFIACSEGVYEYDIVSYFNVYPDDSMYAISYYNKNDYDILTLNIIASSARDLGLTLTPDDEIVVLSTCNNNGRLRFVVCGKKR